MKEGCLMEYIILYFIGFAATTLDIVDRGRGTNHFAGYAIDGFTGPLRNRGQ